MKEFSKEEQVFIDTIAQEVGKVLIATMDRLEIPNYINATYDCDGYKYELNFTKTTINPTE